MQRNIAFKGIRQFEVIKSKKSKTFFPKIRKSPNKPKERAAGIEIAAIIQKETTHAFIREMCNLSAKEAIGTSIILIPEVTAAANNKIKNAADTIFP